MEGNFEGFTVEEVLSRSSTTTVLRAFQTSLNRTVIIKELHPELFQEADILARFKREAQVCALLKHENIVDIYDCTITANRIFLVMEFVPGSSLTDLIKAHPQPPLNVILAVMVQTLRGLDFAFSKGVIHRDLKPSNILIAQNGLVKITDFGLALFEGSPLITQPGAVVGTPAYMSPEAVSGDSVTPRSDIFSLGATFYQLITGEKIFFSEHFSESLKKVLTYHPPPLSQYREDLPPELDRLVLRMLEKHPAKRWDSASEILSALETHGLLSTLGDAKREIRQYWEEPHPQTGVGEVTPSTRSLRIRRRLRVRRLQWIGLGGLLVLFVAVFLFPWQRPSPDQTLSSRLPTTSPESPLQDSAAQPDVLLQTQIPPESLGQKIVSSSEKKPQVDGSLIVSESSARRDDSPPEKTNQTRDEPTLNKRTIPKPVPPKSSEVTASHLPGKVKIQCDPWAEVYINDALIDKTPFNALDLPAGNYRLFFRHPTFPPVVRDIVVHPGEQLNVSVNLWDLVGRVIVRVNTWAEVFIDDQSYGVTPLQEPLIISLGTHKITLRNPIVKSWEKTLTFQRGDPPCTLRVELISNHGNLPATPILPEGPADTVRLSTEGRSVHPDSLPR